MTNQNQRQLLDEMRQAVVEAISFADGLSETEFLKHVMAQRAVTMCLHTIGETASKLNTIFPAFSSHYPAFPIKEMRGMRNRIAHGYSSINFFTVYRTAKDDLPVLLDQIDLVLLSLGQPD